MAKKKAAPRPANRQGACLRPSPNRPGRRRARAIGKRRPHYEASVNLLRHGMPQAQESLEGTEVGQPPKAGRGFHSPATKCTGWFNQATSSARFRFGNKPTRRCSNASQSTTFGHMGGASQPIAVVSTLLKPSRLMVEIASPVARATASSMWERVIRIESFSFGTQKAAAQARTSATGNKIKRRSRESARA